MPGGGMGSVIKWTLLNVDNGGVRQIHVARRNSHKKIQLLRIPSSRQDQNKRLFGALASMENSASKETASKPSLPQIIFRNNEGHQCESFAAQFDAFLVTNGEFTRTLNEINFKCGSESLVKILNCLVRSEGFSQHKALHHHSNGTDKRDQLEFLSTDELNYLTKLTETSKLDCRSVDALEGSSNNIEKQTKTDGLESEEDGQKQVKADGRKGGKKRKLDQSEGGAKKSKRDEVVRKSELETGLEDAFQSKYLCKTELGLDQLFIHPVFENDINPDKVKQIERSMAEVYNREFTITVIPKEKQTDLLGNVLDNKKEFYVISGSKAITALKNLKNEHHPNFAYSDFKVSAVVYEWEGSLVAHYGKVRSNFVASEAPAGGLNIQDFVFMFSDFLNSRMTREKAMSAISKIMLLTKRPPEQRAAMETFCKSLPTKVEKMCKVLRKYETFSTTDVTEKLTTHQKKFSNDKLALPMPVKLFIALSRIPDNLFENLSDLVLQREISVKEMVEKNQNIKDIKNVEQQVCSLLKIDEFQKAKDNYPNMLEPEKLIAFRKSAPPKNNLKLLPRLQLEKYIDALTSTREKPDCGNIEMKEVGRYSIDLMKQITNDSTAIIFTTSGEGNFLKSLVDLSENSNKENQILFLITVNTSAMTKVIETAATRKNNSSLLLVIQFLKKSSSVTTSLIKENLVSLIILGKFSLAAGNLKAFYPDPIEEKLTEVVSKMVSPGQTISVLSPAEVKYKMDASNKLIQSCKIVYYAPGNSLSKLKKDFSTQILTDGSSNPFIDTPNTNIQEKNRSPLMSIDVSCSLSPINPILTSADRVFSPRKVSSSQPLVEPIQSTPIKGKSHRGGMKRRNMADKENLQPLDSYQSASDHLIPHSLHFEPVSQSSLQTHYQTSAFSQSTENVVLKSPVTDEKDKKDASSESSKALSKIATPTLQIQSSDNFLNEINQSGIKGSVERSNLQFKDSTVDLKIKDIVGEITCNLSCHIVEVINHKNLILRVKDDTESSLFSRSWNSETVENNSNLPSIDVWVTHPDIIDKVDQEMIKKGSHIKLIGLECKYIKEEDSQGFSMDYVNSEDMKVDAFQFIIEKIKNRADGIELLDVNGKEPFSFNSVKLTRRYKPPETARHVRELDNTKDSGYMDHTFDFNPVKGTRSNKSQESKRQAHEQNNAKDRKQSGDMAGDNGDIPIQSESQFHTSMVIEEMIESAVTEDLNRLTPQTYKYCKDDKEDGFQKLDKESGEIADPIDQYGTYIIETDKGGSGSEKLIGGCSLQRPVAVEIMEKELSEASNKLTSGYCQSSPIAEEDGLRSANLDADKCEILSSNDALEKRNSS